MTPREITEAAARILDSKKALDIKIIEIEKLTILADFFILCTGTSNTHVRTLANEVEEVLKRDHGIVPHHVEGYSVSNWVLMDYGSVIVHIFLKDARDFYSIERLWGDAPVVEIAGITGQTDI